MVVEECRTSGKAVENANTLFPAAKCPLASVVTKPPKFNHYSAVEAVGRACPSRIYPLM